MLVFMDQETYEQITLPSDFPDFAQFLVECGIDSISLIPDTVISTTMAVNRKEVAMKGKRRKK